MPSNHCLSMIRHKYTAEISQGYITLVLALWSYIQ